MKTSSPAEHKDTVPTGEAGVGFTPGPWAAFTEFSGARPHTNIIAVKPRTKCVFSLPGHRKDDPDVELIAAAPALYEALEILLGHADFTRLNYALGSNARKNIDAALAQASAALKKARGES